MDYKKIGLSDENSLFSVALNLILILLIVFLIISINNKVKESKSIGLEKSITVSGEAELSVDPNLAFIRVILTDKSQSIDEAISQNVEKMKNIVGIVTILGVEREDIRTILFDVCPVYQLQSEKNIIYEIERHLEIKVKRMDRIGNIINGMITNKADNIESLRFSVDNIESLKEQTRSIAIDNAQFKASQVSEQLGVSLIEIINFSEDFTIPQFSTEENLTSLESFQEGLVLGKMKAVVNITYKIE